MGIKKVAVKVAKVTGKGIKKGGKWAWKHRREIISITKDIVDLTSRETGKPKGNIADTEEDLNMS